MLSTEDANHHPHKKPNVQQHPFAELSFTLFDTLDFQDRMKKAAQFAVSKFCDWCAVDVVNQNGVRQYQTIIHSDPKRTGDAEALCKKQQPMRAFPRELMPFTPSSDAELRSYLSSDEELALFKKLRSKSFMILPLFARGSVFGNITFVSSHRAFNDNDLSFAKELAGILGLSADNARLYVESQNAIHSRDEVLGVVAHDLKNPLSAIRLSSQVFKRKIEQSENGLIPISQVEKLLQSIDRSVERATRLITDLLDFEKATSGRMQINPRPVSVDNLLAESVEFLKPLAQERSLDLTWKNESPEHKVQCEPERIQQVLSNLIGNAIKFTQPKGKIEVLSQVRGAEMVFSVRDNGPGIKAHDLPHLFERYWQAQKTQELGSGLGLPICKGIVEAHRGQIWAESILGEGSTFFFTLPLTDLSC